MPVIYKTGTYAVTHILVAFCVTFLFTGDVHIAVGISLLEPLFQVAAYYMHERAWLKFGPAPKNKAEAAALDMMPPCCHATAELIKKHLDGKK
jgi:uncharacterized membrane protein